MITSFAQQSLLAAASDDCDVLYRQGIVNSHVNGAQFFMSMANVGCLMQSGPRLDDLPDRWDVDVRLTMVDVVSCRSSVVQITSTVLDGGAVAKKKRMLTRSVVQ